MKKIKLTGHVGMPVYHFKGEEVLILTTDDRDYEGVLLDVISEGFVIKRSYLGKEVISLLSHQYVCEVILAEVEY